ncbi:MAG: hypothetical protein ACREV1_08115 [Gammaproteobacteria bacterium]
MKFWTEATLLAKLRLIAFLIVGLTAVHAAFLLYSLYRSEEPLGGATSVLADEARVASRQPLLWMLGAVPFGFILAALVVAQVRRIGGRTERIARLARRMAEGDVEASPVDLTERDELVEVERALNETVTHIAIQGRRQAAQHAATRVLAESETLGRAMPAILKAICESLGWHWSALWTVDREKGALRCGDIWHASTVQLADFSAISQGMTFASGVGLPGRVWASGQSAWIPDVQEDPNFPRLAARLHHDRPEAIVLSDTARIAVARYCDFEPLGPVALGPAQHEVFRLTGWKDTAETRAAVAALHA